MDLSALAELRVDAKPKPAFVLPAAGEFREGIVLAFDQSFSSTGWVNLRMGSGLCDVISTGTYRTPVGLLRGGEQDLERAHALFDYTTGVIAHVFPSVVLYESPPKGHGVRHPEVSLLCALAIRLAAAGLSIPTASVHAKTGKKMVTGNSNADKKVAHAALMSLGWIQGLGLVTNEGQRDAMLVGLAHLRIT